MNNETGAMQIELSTEYYIGHLRKINRSLASQWSLLGAHHRHLNEFIRRGARADGKLGARCRLRTQHLGHA
jgi:hypothetical protein